MNKRFTRLAMGLLIVLMLGLSGCAKYRQIRPVSAGIESVMPSGLRSVVLMVAVEIDNPAGQLTLSDVSGVISRSGKVFGRVAVDPFIIKARELGKYHLRTVVTLDEGVSLLEMMTLLKGNVIEECVVDLYAKVSLKNGLSRKMAYEGLPLKKFYQLAKQ